MNIAATIREFISPGLTATGSASPDPWPMLTALRAKLAAINTAQQKRMTINAAMGSARDDIRRAEELTAERDTAQTSIDEQLAIARHLNEPTPALAAERRNLAAANERLTEAAEIARIAKAVLPKYEADIQAHNVAIKTLTDQLPRHLYAALIERGVATAPRYLEAIEQFRRSCINTFSCFVAADRLSLTHGFGEFHGSGLFHEMRIPVPTHPAFNPNPLTPEQAQAKWIADGKAIEADADTLINHLLTWEPSN
jgi:hypothetical protein